MRRLLLFLGLLAVLSPLHAQEIDRVVIEGTIKAPVGEDVEGINVYNVSSQKGTVTSQTGQFQLEVAENDRVLITALQFQEFTVIVDKGVVETKNMGIYLNPAINQLEEVIVRPYDLSGNIVADVKRIKTSVITPEWDLSYEALEFGYKFAPDRQTSIRGNVAEEALNHNPQTGANILGLVGLLFNKKKSSTREIFTSKEMVTKALRQRYSNAYITETFAIPSVYVNDFIYFAEEKGIDAQLLKSENEIELLEFLRKQSEQYKLALEKN